MNDDTMVPVFHLHVITSALLHISVGLSVFKSSFVLTCAPFHNLHFSKQDHKTRAFRYLQRGVELDPRNPEALVSLAWSLMEIGNFSHAEHYLQLCIDEVPDYQQAYWNYGLLMNKLGMKVICLI